MDVSQHIIPLERGALDRWIRADPDGYLSLYVGDATYFDPFSDKRVDGRDELNLRMGAVRGVALPFTEPRYEMIDPAVYVDGNVAVLTFNLVNYGKPSGSAEEQVLARWNATEVYRAMGDVWQIIHTHWPSLSHNSLVHNEQEVTMAKVTGIGGVFFKSKKNSAALAAWYQQHMGMALEEFGGVILRWPDDKAEDRGLTVWHVADGDSKWFSPSDSSFMINYRVDNLVELLAQLRAGGVEVVGGPESHENGKFAWIMDPDGNKIELWEPMIWDDKNKGA